MMRLWVLGAADTEMAAIEKLLTDVGEQWGYAAANGERVHPGNAYRMDRPERLDVDEVIFVECGMADGTPADWMADVRLTVVDHHRTGDPGYGKPPAEFLSASSVGQVLALLPELPSRVIGPHGEVSPNRGYDAAAVGCTRLGWHVGPLSQWVYGLSVYQEADPSSGDDGDSGWALVPTREQILIAAADHCLEPAYRGRCPGVDPDELMRWRAESRAAFRVASQRWDEATGFFECDWRPLTHAEMLVRVLADVEAARCVLRTARAYVDVRGQSIPELPEAACRDGIPYLATVTDRDGREKIVLGAAPPELVELFLIGKVVPYLTDHYGDPQRGFAGAYNCAGCGGTGADLMQTGVHCTNPLCRGPRWRS
jgi:hypothetical protein